jgi:hypothetical protein
MRKHDAQTLNEGRQRTLGQRELLPEHKRTIRTRGFQKDVGVGEAPLQFLEMIVELVASPQKRKVGRKSGPTELREEAHPGAILQIGREQPRRRCIQLGDVLADDHAFAQEGIVAYLEQRHFRPGVGDGVGFGVEREEFGGFVLEVFSGGFVLGAAFLERYPRALGVRSASRVEETEGWRWCGEAFSGHERY